MTQVSADAGRAGAACSELGRVLPRRSSHLHLHGHTLAGSQQVMTAAGMGVVALGAGTGLLRRPPKRA